VLSWSKLTSGIFSEFSVRQFSRNGVSGRVLSRLLGFGGEMKVGEGQDTHQATFFCSLAGINVGGILRFWGGKSPLTGLDKTLVSGVQPWQLALHVDVKRSIQPSS
jgi:hypothetical protein